MRNRILLVFMVLCGIISISNAIGYKFQGYSSSYHSECKSESLTCVPDQDCELTCPLGFRKIGRGGACYFVADDVTSKRRTLTDAEDFCKALDTRLLWIEDAEELKDLIEVANATKTGYYGLQFWIGAKFDKDLASWVWRKTHDEIEWDILIYGLSNAEETLEAIEDANTNKCLAMTFSNGPGQPLIEETECIASYLFMCKMGKSRSPCAKSASTTCCYSPSYDFYQKNQKSDYASLNLRPGDCKMKIGDNLVACEEVLQGLPDPENSTHMYSPARVGSSYYYVANRDDECVGRDAIIQSDEVHRFVELLMATRENYYERSYVKFGLYFNLEDEKAHWANEKPEDYYVEHWAPGEPKRDESVDGGCGAYMSVQKKAVYLWSLFSEQSCKVFNKLCELPLHQRRSSSKYAGDVQSCGRRFERGVLARNAFSVFNSDEANYGEFPWMAAIMFLEKYGREVHRKFACSGALVHRRFVLTSAHCISSNAHKDFVVVLGQHDLNSHDALLEPKVMEVEEVVIHPKYDPRRSSSHNLALLQLSADVDVENNPHIGLGCLPDPDEIRSHDGDWECYITGWSTERTYGSGAFILKRLESEFTSSERCRQLNDEYYSHDSYHHGYQSGTYYNRYDDPELLCASFGNERCLEDPSPILICKKASVYNKNPFFASPRRYTRSLDDDHKDNYIKKVKPSPKQKVKYEKNQYEKLDLDKNDHKPHADKYSKNHYDHHDEYIISSNGDRFDNNKWYVIGIGNSISECRGNNYGYRPSYGYPPVLSYNRAGLKNMPPNSLKRKIEVFTSVYEYYFDFITYVLDIFH